MKRVKWEGMEDKRLCSRHGTRETITMADAKHTHSVSSIQQAGRGKEGVLVCICMYMHNKGLHRKAMLSHSADAQNRGDALAEHSRHWANRHWLSVEAARQHEGHRDIAGDNSRQQTQAPKACRKPKVKPTGNSEPKSVLKSPLSTSSKILVGPESVPMCSIIL